MTDFFTEIVRFGVLAYLWVERYACASCHPRAGEDLGYIKMLTDVYIDVH